MKSATKLRSLIFLPTGKSHRSTVFTFSSSSKSRNPSKFNADEKQKAAKRGVPLLNEIVEILGSESLVVDKRPRAGFTSEETVAERNGDRGGIGYRRQGVCENDNERFGHESEGISCEGNTQLEISREKEVSEIVHKITVVIRAESGGVSMEEQLDKLGVEIDSQIVGYVLKRCFKAPHKAMKFLNWVKLRNLGLCATETYNTMIYMAGEARDFDLVEQIVEEMEKNKCDKNIKTWTILIQHYGKAKMIGKALLIFEKMRRLGCPPDELVYGLMISLLSDAGKGEIAVEFYREMVQKDMVVGVKVHKQLIKGLAASGDLSGLMSVADDMIQVSQVPEREVYSYVLKSLCVSRRIEESLELIRTLKDKNVMLDLEYFEILVKGLCRAERMQDAVEIVDIMKRKGVVSEKVYGAMVSGYLRKGNILEALEIFDAMKEAGVLPSASTYTELMQRFFDMNEYEKGCVLFEQMVESGVEMDSLAFVAVIAGHVRQNHIHLAFEVFRSMEERGIIGTQKSYSIFIKELCKVSKTEEIMKLLNQMWDSKVTIGDGIFQLVTSYLERKKLMVELNYVKELQRQYRLCSTEEETSSSSLTEKEVLNKASQNTESENQHLPEAYTDEDLHRVCAILSSSKDWQAMQDALETCDIDYAPPLVVEILRRCSLQGSAALHFFSWVGKRAGFRHTAETYNMAIKIAGRGKDFKHMRNLFNEMKRNGCLIMPDTWTIMIMLYGRVGLTDIALQNFAEMKASGCKPAANTYKYLILSLCGKKGRKVDEAIKLFHQMMNTGLIPDKELVEIYLDCLCHLGTISDAKRCVESLRKTSYTTPLIYSMLIRALCRAGKLEEALALTEEVEEEHKSTLNLYIHGSLVNALLNKGRLDEALAKVDEMRESGVQTTAHVYTSLLVHFFKEGKTEAALDMFRRMWEDGCQPTIVTYSALLRGYMNVGRISDAWSLFRRMKLKGPCPDFKTYSAFITSLCDKGKSEEAIQLLSQMLEDGIVPSNVNFRVVFFGLNREGKQELARTVLQQKHALINRRKFLSRDYVMC